MKSICGIYKLTQTNTGKVYIGSSVNIELRKIQHFNDLKNGRHANKNLQEDFNKYGDSSFHFEVIEAIDEIDLKIREVELIGQIPKDKAYNKVKQTSFDEYLKAKIRKMLRERNELYDKIDRLQKELNQPRGLKDIPPQIRLNGVTYKIIITLEPLINKQEVS